MLQCVAVCCSVLHCVAVCCSVLQCAAVCCSVLQCAAVRCSVLQCVAACSLAVCDSVLRCVAVFSNVFALFCSVLQCVAVCYVAVCYSALQRVCIFTYKYTQDTRIEICLYTSISYRMCQIYVRVYHISTYLRVYAYFYIFKGVFIFLHMYPVYICILRYHISCTPDLCKGVRVRVCVRTRARAGRWVGGWVWVGGCGWVGGWIGVCVHLCVCVCLMLLYILGTCL